jgi:HlyD family secretion protein
MKKLILSILVLAAVGISAGAYYLRTSRPEPQVTTMPLSRGDIIDSVKATGTLQPVTTVQVGTQVSGTVMEMNADFNDFVKKGQVIARLDPSLLETTLAQREASLINAEANLERQKVSLEDARTKLKRAQELAARNLVPRTDLETAQVQAKQAEAQLRSSEAQVTQARADVNTAKVNIGHTVITAPIDGIVISRNVDEGQTVAASMNAPLLYLLAADLTKMQVTAAIDEADVGKIRPGQRVPFRVDAYQNEEFFGTVEQVRLQPATVQNVVTYSTVINVDNPQYKLKPGMTANVSIEIARADDVLRVPNAALRFRPTEDMFMALNQPVPENFGRAGGAGRGGQRGGGAGREQPAGTGAAQPATPGAAQTQPQSAPNGRGEGERTRAFERGGGDTSTSSGRGTGSGREGRGFGNLSPEERQKRLEERMRNMSPEERAQFEERMRNREAGGGRGGRRGDSSAQQGPGGGRSGQRGAQPAPQTPTGAAGATTIDSLFGPLPRVESRGQAWIYVDKQLKRVNLRLGITDGMYSQVLNEGELPPNAQVVLNVVTGLEATPRPGQSTNQNPLMPPQRGGGDRGRGGGGGRGGR